MKTISRPQYARIRRILELIREGTRSGDYPNASCFCRELDVSRPTVMRDLDFLRDEERAPIEYVAAYIRERIWHPSQEVFDRRDGSVEVRLETAGWKEIVRWVLSWQPDCRVLSPLRLKNRIEEKLRLGLLAQKGRADSG